MEIKNFFPLFLVALLLVCGCGDSDNGSNVDLSPESKSTTDHAINNTTSEPVEPTTISPILLWEFVPGREYNYFGECSAMLRLEGTAGDQTVIDESGTDSLIRLVVEGQFGNNAKVLVGLEEKTDTQTKPTETMSSIPISEVGFLDTTGEFRSIDPSEQLITMLFLPIANGLTNIGDSIEVPFIFPFKLSPIKTEPELKIFEGLASFTLSDYVVIDGETCAEIDGNISLSHQDSYEVFESEYQCDVDGTSKIYFSTDNGRWKKGELVLLEVVNGWMSIPEEARSQFGGSDKMHFNMTVDMWIMVENVD